MAAIQIEVQGQFSIARAAASGLELPLTKRGDYTGGPWVLDTYDVIVLQ